MDISFNLAQETDIETLVTMMRALFETDNPPPGKSFNERAGRLAVTRLINEPAFGRVWLIRAGAQPIGYVVLTLGYSLEFHGRDAFLDEIYIEEAFRGRGIGMQALALVEDTARKLGVNTLHLEVERNNPQAQKFYQKQGFEDRSHYFLMSKWLQSGGLDS